MNLLDTSAWIEYFLGTNHAKLFRSAAGEKESLIIPSIVLYEIFKRFYQQYGKTAALDVVALMRQGIVIPLDFELAVSAGTISHETGLAMADSIILATARRHDATIWTLDKDFEGMEKVKYFKK